MSNPYNYNRKVLNPHLSNDTPQTRSDTKQIPFFFGGSQIPTDLFLAKTQYNGAKGSGLHKGHKEIHKLNKLGNMLIQAKNDNIKFPHTLPFLK
jgi:hypothetical protein